MNAKHVEALWQSYRLVMPKDASATQIIETRRAFYAGAQGVFHYVVDKLEHGTPDATEADLKFMNDIVAELSEFAKLVGAGVA